MKLALIGFVFEFLVHRFLFINLCQIRVLNPPKADKIGFVLHNHSILIERGSLLIVCGS